MAGELIGFIDVVAPAVAEVLRSEVPAGLRLELLERNSAAARLELARASDVLLAWAGPIAAAEIEASPRLRMIQKTGQGVDDVDLEVATRLGIPVCNGGGANAVTVAEYTILLMLALARRLRTLETELRHGGWPNYVYRGVSWDLLGKTVGIVGLGNIGKQVARRLSGFECRVLYYDVVRLDTEVEAALGVELRPLDDLLQAVDVLTLHVPLDARTRHLIGVRELALLRPGAVLVNACRGPVVDEHALVGALERGHLAGAALDVFEQEPIDLDNPLLGMANVVLTPHAAAGTLDCVRRMVRGAYANISRALGGEPPTNVQNGVARARAV